MYRQIKRVFWSDIVLLSIVVPIYNSEKYLDDCIESILIQSYTQFELLLLDDGSNDNSLNICNKWKQVDNRIKVYTKENSGVSATRNYGIKMSKGDYILFVDSDDYLSKDYFLNMMNVIIGMGEDIWPVSVYDFVGGKGFFEVEKKDISDVQEISQGIIDVYNRHLLNVPFNKLYNKKTLIENNIIFKEDISLGEDLLFNIDYLSVGAIKKITILENNTYFYRVGDLSSLSNKYDDNYFTHQLQQFSALYALFIKLGIKDISNLKENYKDFISRCPNYYWENAPKHRLKKANKILRTKEYKEYLLTQKNNMSKITWHIYNSANFLLINLIEKIYLMLH